MIFFCCARNEPIVSSNDVTNVANMRVMHLSNLEDDNNRHLSFSYDFEIMRYLIAVSINLIA